MLQRTLIFVIVVLSAYWFLKPSKEDPVEDEFSDEVEVLVEVQPTVVPTQEPMPTQAPKPEVVAKPQPIQMPVNNQELKDPNKMPAYKRGVVRWQNVNGWAVSHGDLLQGKIQDDKDIKFGYFKPRPNGLWKSNVIPFTIQKEISDPKPILDAVKEMNERTVIKLVPWQGEEDVLVFAKNDKLCLSYLGKVLPQQPILLSDKCKKDDVIHEIMHALGFVHEQSRTDRDQFVEILTSNIQPDYLNQFDMVPDDLVHEYRGSVFYFDYNSIMLYADTAFAKEPGLKTMKSATPTDMPTSKNSLSEIDIERLYYLYGK